MLLRVKITLMDDKSVQEKDEIIGREDNFTLLIFYSLSCLRLILWTWPRSTRCYQRSPWQPLMGKFSKVWGRNISDLQKVFQKRWEGNEPDWSGALSSVVVWVFLVTLDRSICQNLQAWTGLMWLFPFLLKNHFMVNVSGRLKLQRWCFSVHVFGSQIHSFQSNWRWWRTSL